MTGKWDVTECDGFMLTWCDDDRAGENLGETCFQRSDLASADAATRQRAAEYFAALDLKPQPEATRWGFQWPTVSAARSALRAVNTARRLARTQAATATPMPEWAMTALAAGWKPPRGWKP
jgi:hypothetical protein